MAKKESEPRSGGRDSSATNCYRRFAARDDFCFTFCGLTPAATCCRHFVAKTRNYKKRKRGEQPIPSLALRANGLDQETHNRSVPGGSFLKMQLSESLGAIGEDPPEGVKPREVENLLAAGRHAA
jgi:hypothetical protein